MSLCGRNFASYLQATLAALSFLLPYARAEAREVVDAYAVRKALADAAVVSEAQRLDTLADRQAAAELVSALARLPQVAAKGTIAHDWLLDRGLHALATVKPTPSARALVQQIALEQPQIFIRVDPDHGQHAVPLYDPGATARFVLRTWERTAVRERAAAALVANERWPIEHFARAETAADDSTRSGVVDAFRTADPSLLARQRDALAAALRNGERVDELAAVVAERLGDDDLYVEVLNSAEPVVALDALKHARQALGDARALDVLIAASRRPEIASAALLEIGAIGREEARARAYLFEMLREPSLGPSAAAALASLHDSAVTAELGRQLRAQTPDVARRHMALALKLEGSLAARAQLEQFLATRTGSAKLQKEVRAWLAQ
jgi:hypothetical protein